MAGRGSGGPRGADLQPKQPAGPSLSLRCITEALASLSAWRRPPDRDGSLENLSRQSPTPSPPPGSVIVPRWLGGRARLPGRRGFSPESSAENHRHHARCAGSAEVNSGIFPSYENKLDSFSQRIYGRFHRHAGASALVCLFMSPLLRPGVYFRPQAEDRAAAGHAIARLTRRYEACWRWPTWKRLAS